MIRSAQESRLCRFPRLYQWVRQFRFHLLSRLDQVSQWRRLHRSDRVSLLPLLFLLIRLVRLRRFPRLNQSDRPDLFLQLNRLVQHRLLRLLRR